MWTDFPLVFQMKPFSLIVLTRGDCIQVSSVCKSNEVQAETPRAPGSGARRQTGRAL